jgi:hypothetical protein
MKPSSIQADAAPSMLAKGGDSGSQQSQDLWACAGTDGGLPIRKNYAHEDFHQQHRNNASAVFSVIQMPSLENYQVLADVIPDSPCAGLRD